MIDSTDKIGVVRQHRWVSADKQATALASRCTRIVSLAGGDVPRISREDVEKLVRSGTIVELVHAFLLADPARKRTAGGMRADFRAALARLEKRGAVVMDVDAGICSKKHRRALLALVDSDLARSNRGAKSATNGALSKGRPPAAFTMAQLKEARAIWRNTKDFPAWGDAQRAFDEEVPGFTTARAFKLWRGRQ
jgi:CTP:molybdopterin cytidylyltransferase MocA